MQRVLRPNMILDSRGKPARPAAILICVLVVLLIVGLLISQTVQTLLLVRRGDDMRQSLRQARELVGLAEIVLQQSAGKISTPELTVSLTARQSAADSAVDAPPLSGQHPTGDRQRTALIKFQRIENAETAQRLIRITATYRPGTSAEIIATHIVADKEKNNATPQ